MVRVTITGTNYFVEIMETDSSGDGLGSGTNGASATCLQQGMSPAPANLENNLNETLDSGLNWDDAMDASGNPIWNNLDELGFPCIATITFGRGGCPP